MPQTAHKQEHGEQDDYEGRDDNDVAEQNRCRLMPDSDSLFGGFVYLGELKGLFVPVVLP
jgi:hypothetical protein